MLSNKYWITNCILLATLAFSVFTPTLVYAAPLAVSDKDWTYPNANSWGGNFSPQNQINKDNVGDLEVKWIFTTGSKELAPKGIQAIQAAEGANTPPIIRNGIVVFSTNYNKLYALDAKTGKQLWSYDYTIDWDVEKQRLPLFAFGSHVHAIRYWERENVILLNGVLCDFVGVDLNTGKEKFRIPDTCLDIPGNTRSFRANALGLNVVGTYDKGNLFIFHNAGAVPGPSGGRANTIGIDMTTKKIVWRVFQFPPTDRADPEWALRECDIGWFAGKDGSLISCNDVQSKNRKALMYDWQASPERGENWTPSPYPSVGTSGSWGQPIIDEDTGILYLGQSQASPDLNATYRPGPNLYATASMAIDMNKGQRIWWMQNNPHDLRDYDNNWGGVLTEIKKPDGSSQKVYIKGSKNGYLYALDAKTGKAAWFQDITPLRNEWGKLLDPTSYEDMTRKWLNYPSQDWVIINPGFINGAFATDISYHDNTVFHWSVNIPQRVRAIPVEQGGMGGLLQTAFPWNATIMARDASTGTLKWQWFYPSGTVRGHMAVTGGTVIAPFPDGYIRLLDEKTGKLLREVNLGSPMYTGVTVGKDSSGDTKIFTILGSTSIVGPFSGLGPATPGTIVALGLSEKAPTPTQSVTTVTTTLATTVTKEINATNGLPAEITYAAVAIAVIAIIGAAVLVMRKK